MGSKLSTDERHALSDLSAALSAAEQLGLPALRCLVEIAVNDGLSVSDLAARTNSPQQSASRYAAMLLGRYQIDPSVIPMNPLIEQRIHSTDPRKRSLHVTDAGLELVRSLISSPQHEREASVSR